MQASPLPGKQPVVKPTVGRTVHYVPKLGTVEAANYAKVVPAIVTAVPEGDVVNLKVFTDSNADTWRPNVQYSEDDEPGTWHWPRY